LLCVENTCDVSLFTRLYLLYYQPEVSGLVVRMPIEVEIFRNYRHSMVGKKLRTILDGEDTDVGVWYARAKRLVEDEMQKIAQEADEEGQIDASVLNDDLKDLLGQFLENQETWQEVCLVLEKNHLESNLLVLNRPMASKLTENLGKLCLFGTFMNENLTKGTLKRGSRSKDLVRFMMAFSSDCAVYVGGPDEQGEPARFIHGIANLPGAREISPGSRIYEGGLEAAVQGVLDGKYNPSEFRFFVGCHKYEGSALEVSVHLGKFQPVACARSLALKQCIGLPKPLWHEGTKKVVCTDNHNTLLFLTELAINLKMFSNSHGTVWWRIGRHLRTGATESRRSEISSRRRNRIRRRDF
jgi:hypothetical protein